jgi:hypothetical protein
MTPPSGYRRALRVLPWLAVLLAIGVVVGLGGFAERTDNLVSAAPGAEIDSHNLVFTISGATLQLVPNFSDEAEWKIQVRGSVRNPNDEALAPLLGPTGNFVLHDAASGLTAEPGPVKLGESFHRDLVPPGNSTLPMTLTFTLPPEYVAKSGIELGVAQMEHTANTVLGLNDKELVWNVDSYAPLSIVRLPLTRLPDEPR